MTAEKGKNMKIRNGIAIVALTAFTSMFASQAPAQRADDGIAASPKVRFMMNERPAPAYAVLINDTTPYRATEQSWLAASPKTQENLRGRSFPSYGGGTAVAMANETTQVDDGIAASPKVRQQINASSPATFQVAPIK